MRLKNSINNIAVSLMTYSVVFGFTFANRTVFIMTLGKEYLGLNGLFSNVLMLLSLTELGIGTAVVYNLYKPLAQSNRELIKSLMLFYKRAYRIVAMTVFVGGLAIMPFMDFIIKDKPNIPENLHMLYLLFLCNTVVSYLLIYKKSILIADQKFYIVDFLTTLTSIAINLLQITVLFIFKSYIFYLLLMIASTIVQNILISRKADKMYGYINEKAEPLDEKVKRSMFRDIRGMMIYKVCNIIISGMDTIIISAYIGIVWAGLYSNYLLVINAVRNIILKTLESVTASIGNLNVIDNNEKKEYIFNVYWQISFWIFGFSAICFYILTEPFITLWVGKEFLLPHNTLTVIVILYFVTGMLTPVSNYRTAFGLFTQGQIRPLFMSIASIVFSILLVQRIGITGVFLGILLSRLLTQVWFDPWVIYRYGFSMPVHGYFQKYGIYLLILAGAAAPTIFLSGYFTGPGVWNFVIRIVICLIVPNVVFYLALRKTKEYNYINSILITIKSAVKNKLPGRKV